MSTQKTIEVAAANDSEASLAKQTLFKTGWSYDVYLRKNQFAPSEARQEEWLAISREHSKLHCNEVMRLVGAGAKAKCKVKAVFNLADQRFDTAMTVAVVKPGCTDSELISDALVGARMRFAKTLELMTAAAAHQGAI